jgi:hypothetical protein
MAIWRLNVCLDAAKGVQAPWRTKKEEISAKVSLTLDTQLNTK